MRRISAAARRWQINDEVRAVSRRETAGKPTVIAQAHALYDWVFDHMQ